MPSDRNELRAMNHEYIMLQRGILRMLSALYLEQQVAESQKTPHSWRPFTYTFLMGATPNTVGNRSMQILPANDNRGSLTIVSDPSVNLLISHEDFDIPSMQGLFNGLQKTSPGTSNIFVLPAGATMTVDTGGPIFAAPAKFVANTSCTIGLIETLYQRSNPALNKRGGEHTTHHHSGRHGPSGIVKDEMEIKEPLQ